jgi:hypothetical protein
MKHMSLDQLRLIANIRMTPNRRMSRYARLQRWAEILERDPDRRLNALPEIEYTARNVRNTLHMDNSPLTIAFADPVLREQGLRGETLGDARQFFGLSLRRAHTILCSCMYGRTMSSGAAADAVRTAAEMPRLMMTTLASAASTCALLLVLASF